MEIEYLLILQLIPATNKPYRIAIVDLLDIENSPKLMVDSYSTRGKAMKKIDQLRNGTDLPTG